MPRPDKVAQVEELKERLARAPSLVVVDYRGLPGPEATALRRFLRNQGVEFRVVKNTLAKRAAAAAGVPGLAPALKGPNALLLGQGDPALPFRMARECTKRYPNLQIKAGVFEGQPVSAKEVEFYATLPTREELLARLAGALSGPMRGLALALAGVVRKLPAALSQLEKKKGAEG